MDVAAKIAELKNDIASRRSRCGQNPVGLKQEKAPSQENIPQDANGLLQEIIRIYSLADNIIKIVQTARPDKQEIYLEIANPYIESATDLADVMTPFYTEIAGNKGSVTDELRIYIEGEFRNFFQVLRSTIEKLEIKLISKDISDIEFSEEYIKPTSPLAEKFLIMRSKGKKGTDANRIVRVRALAEDNSEKLFVFAIEELACHIAQILLELEKLEVASFKKGYPVHGYASAFVRRNFDFTKIIRSEADDNHS